MTANDIASARHPRKGRAVPAAIAERLAAERRAARDAHATGDDAEAWRLLERTHILSQPWAWPHVRSHIDMLVLARTRTMFASYSSTFSEAAWWLGGATASVSVY